MRFYHNPFSDCGGELTGTSGVLSSPNYPRDYSSYADCLWVIKVKIFKKKYIINIEKLKGSDTYIY